MTSLRETLAQLSPAKVEVIGIGAHQQPTLAAIILGHGQATLAQVTQTPDTPDGWIYWCGDCVTACNMCDPG